MISLRTTYSIFTHAKRTWTWNALLPLISANHFFPNQRSNPPRWSFSTTDENPYHILNVPIQSSYETVKAAFLKAALRHHPDHSKETDGAEFVRIRGAFEAIVSYHNNTQMNPVKGNNQQSKPWWVKDEKKPPVWKNDAEFQEWFKQATGEHLSFDMNHETRQEVIRVYRTMSSGGKDKGGYWEMARQLAEREDAFLRSGGRSDVTAELGTPTTSATAPIRRKRHR
jgi:DnaJ domain